MHCAWCSEDLTIRAGGNNQNYNKAKRLSGPSMTTIDKRNAISSRGTVGSGRSLGP